MKEKLIIKISIYITCLIVGIFFIASLIWNSINFLKVLSGIATVSYILIFIYCKYLWKLRIRKNTLSKIPNLNGNWDAIIKYKDCKKNTTIKIKQDLFSIQVSLKSDETNSFSLVANILEDHGKMYLIYTYITDPNQEFRDNNPIQWGTAKLDISNLEDINGYYWTTRGTQGSINMTRSTKQVNY